MVIIEESDFGDIAHISIVWVLVKLMIIILCVILTAVSVVKLDIILLGSDLMWVTSKTFLDVKIYSFMLVSHVAIMQQSL